MTAGTADDGPFRENPYENASGPRIMASIVRVPVDEIGHCLHTGLGEPLDRYCEWRLELSSRTFYRRVSKNFVASAI